MFWKVMTNYLNTLASKLLKGSMEGVDIEKVNNSWYYIFVSG